MNRYNPNIHHRRSIRLKGYDYSQAGLYFITICTQNRACLFGEIIDGKMILNEYGIIARDEWVKTSEIRPNVELGEFIIMPNHIHVIIGITYRRGELHSPNMSNLSNISTGLNSPNESNLSNITSHEMGVHVGDTKGECHSANETGVHGGDAKSECNSANEMGVDGGDAKGVHGGDTKGECNSPLRRSPSQTVGAIVRGYKSSVTKQLGLMGFTEKLWQRNYFEHIIRNEQSYQTISEYIINNPMKWNDDTFNPTNKK